MDNKPQLKVDIPPPRKPPSGGAVAGVGGDDDRPKKNETVRIALRPRPTPTFSPTISDPTPRRQLFPESRLMLGMLSPLLGVLKSLDLSARGVSQLERYVLLPHWLAQRVRAEGLLEDHRQLLIEDDEDVHELA
jgi:hypothetical protein